MISTPAAGRVRGERQRLFHPHPGAGDPRVGQAGAGQALGEGLDQLDVAGGGDAAGVVDDGS